MPQFSGNLNFLYAGKPLFEAMALAARDGFKAVEYVSPYNEKPEAVVAELKKNNLVTDLFNSPAGDWGKGERGLLIAQGRDAEFAESIETMKAYAAAIGTKKINLMAGIVPAGAPESRLWDRMLDRLRTAARALAPLGVTVLLEHMNPFDVPGYFFGTPGKALKAAEQIAMDNCKVQYDIYHAARSTGELTQFMRDHMAMIGHIQIADTPGRHQPGSGELNYRFIFAEADRLGYSGRIGLEYAPLPDAAGSLGWIREMGYSL